LELKFRLKKGKGAISGLRVGKISYLPGDIVDLPASYDGGVWLERVDPLPRVKAVPGKATPIHVEPVVAEPTESVPVPFEAASKVKGKQTKKKSES